MGEAEEIPLFFTLIPVLALLSNYDRENCLINVGTEGRMWGTPVGGAELATASRRKANSMMVRQNHFLGSISIRIGNLHQDISMARRIGMLYSNSPNEIEKLWTVHGSFHLVARPARRHCVRS